MRAMRLVAIVMVVTAALAACSPELPVAHVVEDAPRLARVGELLAAPPLRPIPPAMTELRLPYACERCGGGLYHTLQFAHDAGVVYVATDDKYAVLDIGTGEVVATGTGHPMGQISPNGRLLAIRVDAGLELRDTATGEVVLLLPGATGDEFQWLDGTGILHIAPPVDRFAHPRIVYRDLATGLESSLATVETRDPKYILDFGAVPVPGPAGRYLLEARGRSHLMLLSPGPDGVVATKGASRPGPEPGSNRPRFLVGDRFVSFDDDALTYENVLTAERTRVDLPGLVLIGARRGADPDLLLLQGYFKDAEGEPLKRDGDTVRRTFFYSMSRHRLAPLHLDVDPSELHYVASVRGYVRDGEQALIPYTLPPGGEEGEIADVLAAAKAEIVSGESEP